MTDIEVKNLRNAIALLRSRKDLKVLFFNDKGEYSIKQRVGFDNEKDRKQILATESSLPEEHLSPVATLATGEQAEIGALSDKVAELTSENQRLQAETAEKVKLAVEESQVTAAKKLVEVSEEFVAKLKAAENDIEEYKKLLAKADATIKEQAEALKSTKANAKNQK